MTRAPSGVREMLVTLVRAFVDQPDAVEVLEVRKQQATILELRVAAGDLGKVIGKQGRTARALRALVGAAGEKLQERFVLQILD